jgi:hypothetical protein
LIEYPNDCNVSKANESTNIGVEITFGCLGGVLGGNIFEVFEKFVIEL